MRQNKHLADVLGHFVERDGRTARQISRRSAERFGEHHDVPHATISRWVRGEVKKPRAWRDLIKLAIMLELSESEADELLKSAKHRPIATWRESVSREADKQLLSYWDKCDTRSVPLPTPPFQAPPDLSYFTGRESELNALKEVLRNKQPLLCLAGMAGVGKTTLALHLTYQLRLDFPDGVLWCQLDRSDTMSVLRSFADAYGQDVSQYRDLGSRSSKVRELLAGKRALIVLDNAERDEQVRPLLPPSGSCAVIITTRYHDLSVADSAHYFHLKPFRHQKQEALGLFLQILGRERVQREQDALSEIADLLGHLPLAIAIAANRIKREVGWSAANFLRRIRQEERRLTELARGDQGVRFSFSFSYRALPTHLQHFFATLAVFAGEDFTVAAVAYVATLSIEQAEDHLRELYNLSLLQQGRVEGEDFRYKLHPLLRDYSREKLNQARSMPLVTLNEIMLGAPIQQAGRESQAAVALEPAQDDVWVRMVTFFVDYIVAHESDYKALDLELDNLLVALEVAFERHLSACLIRAASAFYPFLESKGWYQQAKLHLTRAEQAARQSGDFWNLATIRHHLGDIAYQQEKYVQAKKIYQNALTLARRRRNLPQISALLTSLGLLAYRQGALSEAKPYYEEAMTVARQAGDEARIATLLTNLALISGQVGNYEEVMSYF